MQGDPDMALLMPLEIRGLGTPDVESLPSYLHRLASAHEVTVAALLKRVITWYQKKYPDKNVILSKSGTAGDISVYVRPNQGTEDLVLMLSEALGNDNLTGTTFLSIHNVVVRTAGIFSKNIRWCPICMYRSELNQDSGYFKLLWSVESITYCPEHDSKLVGKCPVCSSTQGGYGYKADPLNCQKCGASLSQINLEDVYFKPSWSAQGSDMFHLVKFISKFPQNIFPQNSVKEVISREFDKAWLSETEDKLWKIIPKNECIGIAEGALPITLKRARVIAYKFGVNLTDLLLGDISKSPAVLNPEWSSELPPDIRPKEKNKNRNRDDILKNVHNLMKVCKKRPKPLCYYAESVGVSDGYLKYNFQALSNRILTVYKAWRDQEKTRKQREARSEALKEITSYEGNLVEFSKKRTLKKIREETNLPKGVVRKAINDVHRLVIEGTL